MSGFEQGEVIPGGVCARMNYFGLPLSDRGLSLNWWHSNMSWMWFCVYNLWYIGCSRNHSGKIAFANNLGCMETTNVVPHRHWYYSYLFLVHVHLASRIQHYADYIEHNVANYSKTRQWDWHFVICDTGQQGHVWLIRDISEENLNSQSELNRICRFSICV